MSEATTLLSVAQQEAKTAFLDALGKEFAAYDHIAADHPAKERMANLRKYFEKDVDFTHLFDEQGTPYGRLNDMDGKPNGPRKSQSHVIKEGREFVRKALIGIVGEHGDLPFSPEMAGCKVSGNPSFVDDMQQRYKNARGTREAIR